MNGMRTERGQEAAGATREEPRYLPGVRTGRRGRGSGGTGPAARRRVRCRGVARHRRWPPARQLRENVRRGGCPGRRASCESTCGISRSDNGPDPHGRPGRVPRHHRRLCSRRAGYRRAPGARSARPGIGHPGDWRSGRAADQAEAGGGTRCGGIPVSAEGLRVEQLSCRRALTSAAGRSEVLSETHSEACSETHSEVLSEVL